MAKFSEFRVLYLQPKVITLQWEISGIPAGFEEYITVGRSESPEGPWETLQREINGAQYFNDYDARLMNSTITVYYRLTAELRKNNEDTIYITSEVEWLRQRPTAIAREINRREHILLSKYNAEPMYAFIKRTWGPPCPACFDPEMGKQFVSDCARCFDTGILGGFFAPIELFVSRTPTQKMIQDLQLMKVEIGPANKLLWTSATPQLKPGDVLVDANNVRYTIEYVQTHGRLLGADLKQILRVTTIPANDRVYHLAVPEVNELVPYHGRFYWKPRSTGWTN